MAREFKLKDSAPPIKKKLFAKVMEVEKNSEFAIGIVSLAQTDEDRQAIIDFIDKGEDVNYESVLTLAVWLNYYREHPEERGKHDG